MEGELKSVLDDLDKVEFKNRELKENLKDVDECIKKFREKLKKATKRFKEKNGQVKQSNETITNLKLQVEEGKRVEDCLNAKLKDKSIECSKLEQQIVTLRSDLEKEKIQEDKFMKRSILLDEMIANQKASKHKYDLRFEKGESSKENQTSNKAKNKNDKKSNVKQVQNQKKYFKRHPIRQPIAQRYSSFNGYYYS